MRLNLGSGSRAVDGWINIDKSPNVHLDRLPAVKGLLHRLGVLSDAHMTGWSRDIVRYDIRRPLPYPDATVTAIYSSHTLEHLYLAEARRLLAECARVLRPGGVLRLALPDAEALARDFLAAVDAGDPQAGFVFNQRLLAHPEDRPRGLRRLVALAGGHTHRWQPTPAMVERLLDRGGFARVRRCTYHEGEFPDLQLIETRKDSFFIEATRP